MTAPARSPSPRWEDPADRRYQAILVVVSAVAVGVLIWADAVVPDPGVTVAVPERILEVVRLAVPDSAEAQPRADAAGGVRRPPSLERRGEHEDARAVRNLRDVFAHPVFGSADDQMDLLDRGVEGVEFDEVEREEGAGWVAASGDDGREDATLPGGISTSDLPELVELPDYAVVPSARYTTARAAPRYTRPQQVSTPAIAAALRDWQHHAARCRARVAPSFRGRVVIRLQLVHGKVDTVAVQSEDGLPTVLRSCLDVRARRLLRFAEDAHGEAVLPLIYE